MHVGPGAGRKALVSWWQSGLVSTLLQLSPRTRGLQGGDKPGPLRGCLCGEAVIMA